MSDRSIVLRLDRVARWDKKEDWPLEWIQQCCRRRSSVDWEVMHWPVEAQRQHRPLTITNDHRKDWLDNSEGMRSSECAAWFELVRKFEDEAKDWRMDNDVLDENSLLERKDDSVLVFHLNYSDRYSDEIVLRMNTVGEGRLVVESNRLDSLDTLWKEAVSVPVELKRKVEVASVLVLDWSKRHFSSVVKPVWKDWLLNALSFVPTPFFLVWKRFHVLNRGRLFEPHLHY